MAHNGEVDLLIGLLPPLAMATVFVLLLFTAYRATDGAGRGEPDVSDDPAVHRHPDPNGPAPSTK